MKHLALMIAAVLLLCLSTAAMAQTTGSAIATPIAPGSEAPSIGGISPGGVPVAPGAANLGTGGIERIGPGGVELAPGAAGSLGRVPLVSTPAESGFTGGRRR